MRNPFKGDAVFLLVFILLAGLILIVKAIIGLYRWVYENAELIAETLGLVLIWGIGMVVFAGFIYECIKLYKQYKYNNSVDSQIDRTIFDLDQKWHIVKLESAKLKVIINKSKFKLSTMIDKKLIYEYGEIRLLDLETLFEVLHKYQQFLKLRKKEFIGLKNYLELLDQMESAKSRVSSFISSKLTNHNNIVNSTTNLLLQEAKEGLVAQIKAPFKIGTPKAYPLEGQDQFHLRPMLKDKLNSHEMAMLCELFEESSLKLDELELAMEKRKVIQRILGNTG